MESNLLLKEVKKALRQLSIPAHNPAVKRYIRKTKDYPEAINAGEKSQKFGFLKIYDQLVENAMARVKYNTVQTHLSEKITPKDRLVLFFGLRHKLGAFRWMMPQYRNLKSKNEFDETFYDKNQAEKLWSELETYARKKWNIQRIGFTEIPSDIIIEGRHILFKYAIVFIEEMRKDRIDDAPHLKAGVETWRAYNHLGKAVIDIANWLRKKGIRCQPNHPLGGLVSYVPLAGKAGLGGQGMNGLLITPKFGQRQRIAPIYIKQPIFRFTDSTEHFWIKKYCKSCQLCQKECPPDAIQDEKNVYATEISTIGNLARCIDPIKCHPQFAKFEGCSVCIKVCPFSQGQGMYEKIKNSVTKQQ